MLAATLARLRNNPDFQDAVVAPMEQEREALRKRLAYLGKDMVQIAQGKVQAYDEILAYITSEAKP
jgi:hypothetical protein